MKKEKKDLTQANTAVKSRDKKKIFMTIGIVVACLAVVYVGFGIFFQSHFCFGTTIDGIKAGGKSVEKMEQLITEEIDSYVLNLVEREEGQESIAGDAIQIAPVFNGEVEELLNGQNGFAWVVTLFTHENLELAKVVTFDENALDSELQALNCMQAGAQREPVDATVSAYTADGYSLVPADYGTTIDKNAFKKAVEDSILVLADELDLDEAECYVKPEVEDDNEKLLAVIDEMNSYVGTTITYDFDVAKEVLDGERISEWLSVDDDLNLVVDEEGVLSFVKELASKYNTCYKPKELKTSYGSTVTISNGPYGWKINNSEEVAQILDDLKAGKKVEREPVYSQTANSHGENDYGNSYVEINLTSQHLFVYKDGVLVTESDFVSGNVAKGHATPGGAFMLTYKTLNAVLRGPDYETPVTYWMPFNGDIGMHDLTSRKAFGGDIYKTRGSHGCINLPYSAAKKIYETIDKGYCVLVYNLPGTESDSVKQKEAAAVVNTINSIGTVTLESEPVIVAARTAYDALSDTAKSYVTNYQTLVDDEAALAALKSGAAAAAQQPGAEVLSGMARGIDAAISQKVGFLKFRIPFTLCFTPTSPNANGQTVIIFPGTWNESRTSEYSFFCSALQSFITRSSHAISMSRQNKMYASQQNGLNQYTANST